MPISSRKPRVIYFGMINTSTYASLVGENVYVAAGSLKMLSVMRALRSVGVRVCIVTLPVLGRVSSISYMKSITSSKDGIPIEFLTTFRNRIARKLIGAFEFTRISLRIVRSSDRVIIYNHALEYIPGLLVLWARRIKVYHDIEDLPFNDGFNIHCAINSIGYYFASKLSQKKKILVSNQLAVTLALKEYLVIPGVSSVTCEVSNDKWAALLFNDKTPLSIHYGGSLIPDTGIDLFCKAVEILSCTYSSNSRPITFYVTGSGHVQKVVNLKHKISGNALVSIFIANNTTYKDYIRILTNCHMSLALKRPHSQISKTTFPSKAIEITSYGLALISTKVSDIPLIFDEDTAFLLTDYSPVSLVSAFQNCAKNPQKVLEVAVAGKNHVENRFSPFVVGKALSSFLELS